MRFGLGRRLQGSRDGTHMECIRGAVECPINWLGADEKHFSARFPLLGVAGSGLGAYWRGCFRQGDAVVSCGGGEGSAGISYLRNALGRGCWSGWNCSCQSAVQKVQCSQQEMLSTQEGSVKITGHENFRFQVYSPRGRHCFLARSERWNSTKLLQVWVTRGQPGVGSHTLVAGCGEL